MLRRDVLRMAALSGVAMGSWPLHAMSPPPPEPVDEVLSVTVTRPPEHPGALLILARGRTRLEGRPSNMVLHEVEMTPSDAAVIRLWLGASAPWKGTPRDPRLYDIEARWLHLHPKPQLETIIVEGKSQRVVAKVPR